LFWIDADANELLTVLWNVLVNDDCAGSATVVLILLRLEVEVEVSEVFPDPFE
jgi:hypothetical protein